MSSRRRRCQCDLILVIILCFLLLILESVQSTPSPPNVVILLADNLAYNDISIFGAPDSAKTPNLDRIGNEGLQWNNWNSAAHLCSASRAALLTGKYPVRMGIYPGVFQTGAVYGMLPEEITLAEYLRDEAGYATSIVGKWHLGHRDEYLPTRQGFDEWVGIPYHMSGGSVDNHTCFHDTNQTLWLPLYQDTKIVQQPVKVQDLAERYATAAGDFIQRNAQIGKPFFLYMAFSHVHQLCAPRDYPEQEQCQWAASSRHNSHPTFADAVEEMDWIAGEILQSLDDAGVANDTLVLFTSDNGPWVAEQECSGSKGPFEGRWLEDNVNENCTACPHSFIPQPTRERPRQCILPGTKQSLDGVSCGADTGLGSVWEANLRMPALSRWPGHIPPGSKTSQMVSSLDVVPTVLSVVGITIPKDLDGKDISHIMKGENVCKEERVLFFWRDGFKTGPFPAPYGRLEVAAAKLGRFKAWFWTKSAHYNDDDEVFHDPPLLFDVMADPAEAFPLDTVEHQAIVDRISVLVEAHKSSIDWTFPLTLPTDPKYIPCFDRNTGCRTDNRTIIDEVESIVI